MVVADFPEAGEAQAAAERAGDGKMALNTETRKNDLDTSPIVAAIAEAERGTTGEIRVHITKRLIEPNVFKRAQKVFTKLKMNETQQRNAILLYVNIKRHRFAIVGDQGIHAIVGKKYWEELSQGLTQDLQSTHYERAIAIAVKTLGETLKRYFPSDTHTKDELSNEVTHD